jgi:flagellar protein FliO/FliZ
MGAGGTRTLHVYDGEVPAQSEPEPLKPLPSASDLLARWKRRS